MNLNDFNDKTLNINGKNVKVGPEHKNIQKALDIIDSNLGGFFGAAGMLTGVILAAFPGMMILWGILWLYKYFFG